ncbi:glycosyltransferase family 2 protein [Methylomonas sp. SURF-1]|uniref:Glycosyltransferase family 2 protein n=1 Tax=Methylomonas aurea TaxID=2952224 RepID=A0ABT1UEW6_9GAMM|nr:glycosyltransferase [Methylomonas sp. SURF-1]MCQ8180764.1 glycosyltransferase family 2 protein [Methylomonas sp. SURF-1]
MKSPVAENNEITVAICSYNAAHYLPKLLEALVTQNCPIPFNILIVDNNSTDNTRALVADFAAASRIPVRYVHEPEQGIVFARNRAINESLAGRYIAFIDADELPEEKWLQSAVLSLSNDEVDCVGGRINVSLSSRPHWLSDDLLPFYGQLEHGPHPFRIIDESKPIWSGNVAYNMRLFRSGLLRFDNRYNRKGEGIGGGSDAVMFQQLLKNNCHLMYEPNMSILHLIPESKIKRSYFLKLHFIAGKKSGLYKANPGGKRIFGIPGFMFLQLFKKFFRVIVLYFEQPHAYMREAMNLTYHLGMMRSWAKLKLFLN